VANGIRQRLAFVLLVLDQFGAVKSLAASILLTPHLNKPHSISALAVCALPTLLGSPYDLILNKHSRLASALNLLPPQDFRPDADLCYSLPRCSSFRSRLSQSSYIVTGATTISMWRALRRAQWPRSSANSRLTTTMDTTHGNHV